MGQREYFTAYEQSEEDRLVAQGRVLDPLTRRVFEAAGLARGMRVLDLGCGVGNVSRLAAELVGQEGSVVGVDRDQEAVSRAKRLTAKAGIDNIQFQQADLEAPHGLESVGSGFDAVVGRFVLMYLADHARALWRASELVRRGGLVCMQEADVTYAWSSVDATTWRQLRTWILGTFEAVKADTQMGPRLFATFHAAGLPDPEVRMEAPVGGGENAPAFGWANFAYAALPLMERFGIATAHEVGPDTLIQRLLAEVHAERGVVIGPCLYGAWATKS
jgi:2-polyprenyl-3-methyl-5-hydroxy-6-metoxy-1,4-benzoquinol methylase